MEYRELGKSGFRISAIGLGTWQVGGRWGNPFDEKLAANILDTAIDHGVNFIDTADVYSDGLSEKAVGQTLKRHRDRIYVATKCGRRIKPHMDEGYTTKALRQFVEKSLTNLGLEKLDLIQLHCPPAETYYRPEIFGLFDRLRDEGKVLNLGVSVQKVEEGIKCLEYPNVSTVQIIFNMFRQRPSELFFREATRKNVGIIVRVPLASGLFSGKYDQTTSFGSDDHRFFNREGARFDKGETFSGIPYELGLEAVQAVKAKVDIENMVHLALRWILDFPEVSTIIPGASQVSQVVDNLGSLQSKRLSPEEKQAIDEVYNRLVKPLVHQQW